MRRIDWKDVYVDEVEDTPRMSDERTTWPCRSHDGLRRLFVTRWEASGCFPFPLVVALVNICGLKKKAYAANWEAKSQAFFSIVAAEPLNLIENNFRETIPGRRRLEARAVSGRTGNEARKGAKTSSK